MSGRRAVASNAEDSSTAADGPLRGLRVLDLSTRWGMYASKLLADLGADVIKVEPPVGSEQRAIGPFVRELGAEGSVFFWYHNTSKRSVTIDLDSEEGVESLRRLAASADVLIEGYPVGYLPERSLGYEDLRRINDGLIYASISPFGQSGPRAHWAGDDIVAAAMARRRPSNPTPARHSGCSVPSFDVIRPGRANTSMSRCRRPSRSSTRTRSATTP